LVKMYLFIAGCQRLVWCPKCAPASKSSLIVVVSGKLLTPFLVIIFYLQSV